MLGPQESWFDTARYDRPSPFSPPVAFCQCTHAVLVPDQHLLSPTPKREGRWEREQFSVSDMAGKERGLYGSTSRGPGGPRSTLSSSQEETYGRVLSSPNNNFIYGEGGYASRRPEVGKPLVSLDVHFDVSEKSKNFACINCWPVSRAAVDPIYVLFSCLSRFTSSHAL